jgi:inorganic pyrophosphatase
MQLDQLPAQSEGKQTFNIVIETTRGSRNKYSYDPERQAFALKKVLPEGLVFPFDFGFIPQTKGEDGDPLDVLVLMDEPVFAGCIVECRLIGVLEAKQEKKGKLMRNDRFLAVAESSLNFKRIHEPHDLAPEMLTQIRHFFVSYNEMAGKEFKPLKLLGSTAARRLAMPAHE